MAKSPQSGERITAEWGRGVVAAIRAASTSAGVGLRAATSAQGTVISQARPRTPGELTDTGRSVKATPLQRSIERAVRGLQLRHFAAEDAYAKVNGTIGDWIVADPETGEISAKEGTAARCIELVVRVTNGSGQNSSDKEIKYLRLDVPGYPADPGDVSDPDPSPPPPCGHPGNDGGGFGDVPPCDSGDSDHPGDTPGDDEHPGDTVSPPCGG